MGFPVKVTPRMYERIRERAEERRITLQDALTEILTEPQAAVEELQTKYAELVGHLRRLEERSQRETSTLRGQVEEIQTELTGLRSRFRQMVEACRSWVPKWKAIPRLRKSTKALQARIQSLEKETHHHLLQNQR